MIFNGQVFLVVLLCALTAILAEPQLWFLLSSLSPGSQQDGILDSLLDLSGYITSPVMQVQLAAAGVRASQVTQRADPAPRVNGLKCRVNGVSLQAQSDGALPGQARRREGGEQSTRKRAAW